MLSAANPAIDVNISNVTKTYYTRNSEVQAVKRITLDIYKGEFISIIGPSGCGKTTLLRLLAGLEQDYTGDILLNGSRVEKPGLERGIIFQEHRLLPWLTVGENVKLGVKGKSAFLKERVRQYLSKVGLEDFVDAYPSQLSGGMAQRAAIARALICQPKVMLLDEPLGALDALTRVKMQAEIEKIWLTEQTTMVLVTHDIEEAIFLGDRVVVMSPRPAEIHAIFEIGLPRTRNRNSSEFQAIRKSVVEAFNQISGSPVI